MQSIKPSVLQFSIHQFAKKKPNNNPYLTLPEKISKYQKNMIRKQWFPEIWQN
jgi:hypothetical protein